MKSIKNYSILIISTIILMFSGCSFASHTEQPVEPDPIVVNDDDNQNSYVSNPWTEVTKADVEEGLGIEINLPDDAQNIVARQNSSVDLYEILFDYNDLNYTYRIKKSAGDEDISGLYYDWTLSYEETVEGYDAIIYSVHTEDGNINLITWHDTQTDISFSLSTNIGDLNGFHITEIVKQLINKGSEDLTEENLYDVETIREILAQKYTCDTPPFYTVLDHITEDGLYVYHIYESVDNEVEAHSATIDWVTVDPKTGEATTFFDETFNIKDYMPSENVQKVSTIFDGAEDCTLTEEDFIFEYEGYSFSIDTEWTEYVDKLGYPEEFMQNNNGYIATDAKAYWWSMRYPNQHITDFDVTVVLGSPSFEWESKDTFVSHIDLDNVPTARGIKGGDPLNSLISAYGKPHKVVDFGNPAGWVIIIYGDEERKISFVTDTESIIYAMLE